MAKRKQTILVLIVLILASLVGACKAGGEPSQPGAAPSLVGTEWALTSLDGSSLIENTEITLYFEETHLGGAMTCNGYGGGRDSGKYTAAGDGTLTILQLAVTIQLCSSPEGLMEQEAAYIEALHNAATYRMIDDRLEIADASGGTVLVYTRGVGHVRIDQEVRLLPLLLTGRVVNQARSASSTRKDGTSLAHNPSRVW